MFNTILVAIDSSDASDGALELASQLAKADGARLVLTNVVDLTKLVAVAGYETPYPMDVIRIMQDDSATVLNTAKGKCDPSIQTVVVSGEGDACDEILRIAKDQRAGLIVMGTHARSGITRLVLGSVAEGVLRRSEVPVLVTRK